MCPAPQQGALFPHHSCPKCSGPEGSFSFSLQHVPLVTTACNFSSSLIWPQGSPPAALASLRFDPPEPQTVGKTQCIAASWLFLFSDLVSSFLFPLPFSSLTLGTLVFPSVHIIGSLTCKLPSGISFTTNLWWRTSFPVKANQFCSNTFHSRF